MSRLYVTSIIVDQKIILKPYGKISWMQLIVEKSLNVKKKTLCLEANDHYMYKKIPHHDIGGEQIINKVKTKQNVNLNPIVTIIYNCRSNVIVIYSALTLTLCLSSPTHYSSFTSKVSTRSHIQSQFKAIIYCLRSLLRI